jgi:hypothetical protein
VATGIPSASREGIEVAEPVHDQYGKRVLREAAGAAFDEHGESRRVWYGAGRGAELDGTVGGTIAVEVESRTTKQVRGAILDLICHPLPDKLLLLVPAWIGSPAVARTQCETILRRFLEPTRVRVVVLEGTGHHPCFSADAALVRGALAELGFEAAP